MGASRTRLQQDMGATGLQETMGIIRDDFLDEWKSTRQKVKQVDEMLRNSTAVGALRLAVEMAIKDVDFFVMSDRGEDDPRKQLVEDSLDAMTHSLLDHITDALLMPFYGWSMHTITYQQVNGRWLWRKIKALGHDTIQQWLLDDDGGWVGLKQWPHLWPEPIPIERMIIYRFRNNRNSPEGESILRPAWISWYYLKNIQQIEAIGIERNLAGMPVVTPPLGADMTENTSANTDYGRAHHIVRNVRNDEQGGVILPPPVGPEDHQRWRFELMTTSGASKVVDTDMVISRYDKRILMSGLAQFLMLGMDNVGALSTFKGGNNFFTAAVNAIAGIVTSTFTKFPIPRLLALNGMEGGGIKLEHSPAGDIDLDIISEFLRRVGNLITWTEDDEVWLRSVARMPEKTTDELAKLRAERQIPMNGGLLEQ